MTCLLAMVVTVLNIVIFLGMTLQFLRTAKTKALKKIIEMMDSDTSIYSIASFDGMFILSNYIKPQFLNFQKDLF